MKRHYSIHELCSMKSLSVSSSFSSDFTLIQLKFAFRNFLISWHKSMTYTFFFCAQLKSWKEVKWTLWWHLLDNSRRLNWDWLTMGQTWWDIRLSDLWDKYIELASIKSNWVQSLNLSDNLAQKRQLTGEKGFNLIQFIALIRVNHANR